MIRNWEQIKAGERAAGGGKRTEDQTRQMPAAFAGLSRSLPALAYAYEMQGRAASLGYDWPDLEGVIDKIAEEASELLAATEPAHVTEEYGDLLFVVVNLGRKMGVDPEACAAVRVAQVRLTLRACRALRRRTRPGTAGDGARCARRALAGGQARGSARCSIASP